MKKIILFGVILLMISLVTGSEYKQLGWNDEKEYIYYTVKNANFGHYFRSSETIWSCNIPETSYYGPYTADLNDDGMSELIVFQADYIMVYDGFCNLIDELNVSITGQTFIPTGEPEIVDFLTSYSGDEIVMGVNTNNATDPVYALWAVHWNGVGGGWVVVTWNTTQESNGLNCKDIDGDSLVECIFFDDNGNLFMYDENSSSSEPSLLDYMNNTIRTVCPGAVPYLIDYDTDGDRDILLPVRFYNTSFGFWQCSEVHKIKYGGGTTFTYDGHYEIDNHGYRYDIQEVGQVLFGNMDSSGPKEIIISFSGHGWYTDPAKTFASGFKIFNASGTNAMCGVTKNHRESGCCWQTPYVTGLRLWDGFDEDDDLELWVGWLQMPTGVGTPVMYDYYGIYDSDCTEIAYAGMTSVAGRWCGMGLGWTYGSSPSPVNWGDREAKWADMDNDGDLEMIFGTCVYEEDGEVWDQSFGIGQWGQAYTGLGEMTGDAFSEFVWQFGSSITVYHSVYDCSDLTGINYTLKDNITYQNITYWDFCVNSTHLSEAVCYADSNDTIIKNCTDYGSAWSCFEGECREGNVPPSIINMTDYGWDTRVSPNRWLHHSAYVVDEKIMFKGNINDANPGDSIYLAVDCDIYGGAPYVGDWGPANQLNTTHDNCTYNNISNYTARIYVTDAYGGDWGNYSIYTQVSIKIQECFNYLDCLPGYMCDANGNCYIPTNTSNCSDTDNGIDENVTGTITTPWENLTDYCYDGDTVFEYYCDNSSPSGYYSLGVNCASGWICYQGQCTNITNTTTFKIYVKDYNTNLPLSGITYTVAQYPSYTIVASGTINNGEQELSLELGYYYQLLLEDSSNNYKRWWENWWYPDGSDINALMEKHCFGTCVYTEYFGYTDSPYHHGWYGANYSTYYHSILGFVGNIDISVSSSDWYTIFPAPTSDVTIVEYDIQMANGTPADGNSLKVYFQDESGDDIFALWYIVDETSGNEVWYFDTTWHEIPLAQDYLSTTPIDTYLLYQKSTGQIDIYLDSLNTGNYIFYIENNAVISALDLERIEFDIVGSPNNRKIFVDNIEVSQSEVEPDEPGEEGDVDDPTEPSVDDLTQPWYRDAEGELKFDASVCTGYKSYIMCAVVKYAKVQVVNMVSWIFTGVHILYFIVVLGIIILVGPLLVEFFKSRK